MVKIKKPGSYLIGRLQFCGDRCCSEVIWENQDCAVGDEFDENVIDTEFMTSEEFEIVETNFNS